MQIYQWLLRCTIFVTMAILPVLFLFLYQSEKPKNLSTLFSRSLVAKKKQSANSLAKWLHPNPNHISILFGGDLHFSFANAQSQVDRSGRKLIKGLKPAFQTADYRIVNLETTLARLGPPAQNIKYPFYAHKKAVRILKKLKIDQVILANNHSLDYGSDSLLETMKKLSDANIAYAGAGKNIKEAQRVVNFNIANIFFGNYAISMVGRSFLYAGVNKPGVAPRIIFSDLRRESQMVDHFIVSLHWGREYYVYPTQPQINYARKLIKNGARIVFGHHPHIPQAIEIFRDGVIFYSLGNLSFGTRHELQDHNILIFADFDRKTKKLRQLRVLPINGRYWENGHKQLELPIEERLHFLKRYWLMIKKVFPKTARKATIIKEQGLMIIRL